MTRREAMPESSPGVERSGDPPRIEWQPKRERLIEPSALECVYFGGLCCVPTLWLLFAITAGWDRQARTSIRAPLLGRPCEGYCSAIRFCDCATVALMEAVRVDAPFAIGEGGARFGTRSGREKYGYLPGVDSALER
jgi:hypothetical protein